MGIELTPNQALDIWCRASVDGVRRDAPDLSARQLALLLLVYMTEGRIPCGACQRPLTSPNRP